MASASCPGCRRIGHYELQHDVPFPIWCRQSWGSQREQVALPVGIDLIKVPLPSLEPPSSKCDLLAKEALESGYASMDTFSKLCTLLPRERARNVVADGGAWCSEHEPVSFTTGAYVFGQMVGLRSNVHRHAWLSTFLAVSVRSCTDEPFSSVAFMRNVRFGMHSDANNLRGSRNTLIPVSRFSGGELWVEDFSGPDLACDGRTLGRRLPLQFPGVAFDPQKKHHSCEWQGKRIVVAAFHIRDLQLMSFADQCCLKYLNFPLVSVSSLAME